MTAENKKGKIVGWVMRDKQTKTGELCIRIEGHMTLVAKQPSELQPDPNVPLRPPWYHKDVLVLESDNIRTTFEKIFQQTVKGMSVTFQQVMSSVNNFVRCSIPCLTREFRCM